jgi:Big-like domain-containing protein
LAEYETVQPSGGRQWRPRAALGLVSLLTALAAAGPAVADAPPDVSHSTLGCTDTDGGVLRRGDDLTCTLITSLSADSQLANVTATITLPADVDFVSAGAPYDGDTRTISFDENALGLLFPGQQRLVKIHVAVGQAVPVGEAVSIAGNVAAVGGVDGTIAAQSLSSNELILAPLPTDLSDTGVACTDVDGPPLLPGQLMSCRLDVTNPADREDASSVSASMIVGGVIWVSGGTPTTASSTIFSTDDLGTVGAGATKSVSATFAVPANTPGGTLVSASTFLGGLSTPSALSIFLIRKSSPLEVSPGPASLLASSLICLDTDGGLLLAGDDLTCTVTVAPAAGREDVQGAAATIQIPDRAVYVSGGDSHDATSLTLDPASLGDVAAGAKRSAAFHLKVATGTPVGSELQPSGELTATSVPLGGAIQQPLSAQVLTVGKEVVPPGAQPTLPEGFEAPATPTVKPPATAAKSYKLKARTIVITMRHGHSRGRHHAKHVWSGSRRQFRYVKKFVVRTPKVSGKVVKKVSVPKKGKYAPKRGTVKIKGTRLTYTLKKRFKTRQAKDRFHYTVTDTHGKKATGTIVVRYR